MSNSSYGKIILFRTEDLIAPATGQSAIGLAGATNNFYVPFGVKSVFEDESAQSDFSIGEIEPKLPFNEIQNQQNLIYRSLFKNYKLTGGILESVKYNQFKSSAGLQINNFLINYADIGADDEIKMILYTLKNGKKYLFTQPNGIAASIDYSPNYAGSNFGFLNHNVEISRPLTTGKSLTSQEVLALPSDVYQGSTIFTDEFAENLEKYGNGDTLKVTPVYNYYLKDYEKFYKNIPVATSNLPYEKAIPNFYYLLSIISDKQTYANITPGTPSQLNINSINFRPYQLDLILKSLSATRFLNYESEIDDSLKTLVSPVGTFLPEETIRKELNPAIERNSVVVVTPSFYKEFSSVIREQKNIHPYYNEIKIPVQKGGTVFRDLFKKVKFYDQLQYRAALQIKLVNKYLSLGGNISNLLSNYEVYYNKVIPASEIKNPNGSSTVVRNSKVVFANSALDKELGLVGGSSLQENTQPYQSFGQIYSFGLVEFDLALAPNNLTSTNLNYKDKTNTNTQWLSWKNVSSVGNIPIKNYEDASFIKISNSFTTEEYFKQVQEAERVVAIASGIDPIDAPAVDEEQLVSNPLIFYSDSSDSENDYIAGILQSKANDILDLILYEAKLNVFSVFNNKKNYSEILFFEVQKIDSETDKLIQTFILPNDPEIGDVIEYIDSQIQYGKGYIYKFYAHTVSVGNNIRRIESTNGESINDDSLGDAFASAFTDIGTVDSSEKFENLYEGPGPIATEAEDYEGYQVNFKYENFVSIKLIRAPYQNTQEILSKNEKPTVTYNIDSPPVPPNVEFFPFKNVNDKIGFWFNVGIGSIKMKPIVDFELSAGEKITTAMQMGRIAANQLMNGEITQEDFNSVNILYKTDDFGGKIQVYRVTSRPTAYSDFKDNKIADIDVVGPRSFVDDIIPNQDYYYVFRHVDVHNLPSNPSPVYHLKMVSDVSSPEAGSVRVGIDGAGPMLFNKLIYLNDENKLKVKEKTFKKYLLVERTLNQSYLNFSNFEADGVDSIDTAIDVKNNQSDLNIGSTGNNFISVNGKKFKIRVTSKQTGKKIDLNIDFKNLSVIENYGE